MTSMVRRYPPLSERQDKVLSWVADGCPDGVWSDYSYKHTAYALAARELVTVDRRRGSWSAEMTDQGRHYLAHGTYPPSPAGSGTAAPERKSPSPSPRRNAAPSPAERSDTTDKSPTITPQTLIADLRANGGVLSIPDPDVGVRADYRSAISRAATQGLVPDGHVLRHKGRDHGDLVIRLVPREQAKQKHEQLAPIGLPRSLEDVHKAVHEVRHRPELLDVGQESHQRALLTLQAIALEAERRGYGFGLREDGQPTFQITVGDDISFAFVMTEEFEPREVLASDGLSSAKYDWQRVQSTVQQVRSGRLLIRSAERRSSAFWADRKRWALTDRLPHLFEYITKTAAEIIEQRTRAKAERERRRQDWELAIAQARESYVADLNRQRLEKQLAAATHAQRLRGYAAQIDRLAIDLEDPVRSRRARDWSAWIRTEADTVDPLRHAENLTWVEPKDVQTTDFDPFMPRGMTAWRPPD